MSRDYQTQNQTRNPRPNPSLIACRLSSRRCSRHSLLEPSKLRWCPNREEVTR